ncbi:MAG: 4a-hydroxytetrahydrobiopterin dehydratase [Planctomycetes bacterium]|jgi:4a-hydroxytetrahydrobiopterin dehydratase|nr:4a-hydroxytetrahydrobiopterin dehydratase [Planctomycetota bacterium]
MAGLVDKKCVPCDKNAKPIKGEDIENRRKELTSGWRVVDEHHLERQLTYDDLRQALDFVNEVGDLAEEEGHHPDLYLGYGKVKIQLRTHKSNGLHEDDSIMAAKIDALQPAPVR